MLLLKCVKLKYLRPETLSPQIMQDSLYFIPLGKGWSFLNHDCSLLSSTMNKI